MWIKICGITRLDDAETAISAGADAIGFVFAESPRRVTPQAVRSIVRELPASVEKIGVFVDATGEELTETCEMAGLTGVQMHGMGYEPPNFRAAVNGSAGLIRRIWTLRYNGDPAQFARELDALRPIAGPAGPATSGAILIDTCVSGRHGGSGVAFDWSTARESFQREASHLRLIAAGGLRPDNVAEAIRTLRPWGVDVSSGVESSPGKKDPDRIREFIRAARQAVSELSR